MPLSLLHNARQTLQRFAPDFAKLLTELPFEQREAADSPVVDWFKHTGPVALLVPKAGGGLGASACEALQVQLALGALSPSLAVASTMLTVPVVAPKLEKLKELIFRSK